MRSEAETLPRGNVSDAVAAAVRAMIVEGRLRDGERVNEVRLAERLGVSRTPLREALSRLATEGALDSTPSRGYSVRPLNEVEFDQLYGIRPILEPAALRLAGIPGPTQLDRLESLNAELSASTAPERAIELDDTWHLELLAACPNRILIEMIRGIIVRTRRYELALMRESSQLARAEEDHARVLAALRQSDLTAACIALKRNMESGREPIIAWLRDREAQRAS